MRWKIQTELPVTYHILQVHNLFDPNDTHLVDVLANRVLVIIDRTVSNLYLDKIESYFQHHGVNAKFISIIGEEEEKNLDNLLTVIREIERFGVDRRNEPVLAIGGGVVCDVVGLAASMYRRGIPYVRVPTTLLGMVDVSVAAKTAINFEDRRNRLGSYYPPDYTFIDKSFLPTVSDQDISSGIGEIIKIAVIKDKQLFELLEQHTNDLHNTKFDIDEGDEVIERAVYDMLVELENNLWEKDLQRCVDFGHSFSPIIEMRSLVDSGVPSLTHGQAVTLDVIFSSVLAHKRGLLTNGEIKRIIKVARNAKLPVVHPYFVRAEYLWESLQDTVKHRNGNQNLPVPKGIGKYVFLQDVTYREISEVIKQYKDIVSV